MQLESTQGNATWPLDFHEDKAKYEYLGTSVSHYDGELSGIVRAREVNILGILTDSLSHEKTSCSVPL